MITGNRYLPENTPIRPFIFRQRIEQVDWKRVASIDVNKVIAQVDIDTLQETLSSVAFCDITRELDMRYADNNLLKLFQLAQLMVEYLLHSQDYLISTLNALKEENLLLQKELTNVKEDLAEKTSKLTVVRRECHRRRLLLLAQQQLMDTGPQSYHRCIHCPKAFLNASFLMAHIHRRHPETEKFTYPKVTPASGQATIGENEQTKKSELQTALENDVRELLTYLRTHSFKSGAINSNQNQKPEMTLNLVEGEDELPRFEPPSTRERAESNWKTAILEENRRELDALQRRFEKQLQNVHRQATFNQGDVAALKLIPANSNVCELVDDDIISSIRQDRNAGLTGQSQFSFPPQPPQSVQYLPQTSIETAVGGGEVNHHPPVKLPIDDPSTTASTLLSAHSKISPLAIAPSAFNNLRTRSRKDLNEGAGAMETKEEPVLRTTGQRSTTLDEPSMAPYQDLDGSILRYSQLLEQLKSDPQALQGVKHEVEQLLLEQLTERSIRIGQTRLSTLKLHEYLASLKRDREHLCRKHPGFMEIRENLSQHIDRLAHATLGGKRCFRMTNSTFEMESQPNVKSRSLSRSRLLPPVAFSQESSGRSGSIHSIPQGINIQSSVGQSMPTLSDHGQEQQPAVVSKFRSTGSIGITDKRKESLEQRTQFKEAMTAAEPNEKTIASTSPSILLQQNTNALVTFPLDASTNWNKTQSIQSDEDELGSISSLNGGGRDDTSSSPLPKTNQMQARGANDGSSLTDPHVSVTHIKPAVFDQRPKTRTGRHLGNQELRNTEPSA